jgi:hypothetical protein
MNTCRCVSVHPHLEYDMLHPIYTVHSESILIEDINDDGKNELIIGTSNGEIMIYKEQLGTPWLKSSKPEGPITCIAFDSITNSKKKYLIVNDSIGYLYMFSINQTNNRKRYVSAQVPPVSKQHSEQQQQQQTASTEPKFELKCYFQTKLLPNPHICLISDLCKKFISNFFNFFFNFFNFFLLSKLIVVVNNCFWLPPIE